MARYGPISTSTRQCALSSIHNAIQLEAKNIFQGVFQMKYLYAEHVFGWDAEQVRSSRQSANKGH